MKHVIIFIFLFTLTKVSNAQNLDFLKGFNCEILIDENYGKFDRNKFDIIIPNNTEPHGLIIYLHGGGFINGDKEMLYRRKDDVLFFLENNIAVATINYRYLQINDSLGVNACLHDIKTALQFIRFNALKYNIDKSRVAAYGSSAGAGSSLFLAFHDEMAIEGDSTLLGESTRLKCVGAIGTQSTYNVFAWKKIIPWYRIVTFIKRKSFNNDAANFYGYPNYKSFKANHTGILKDLNMLEMIDSQDPPVYLVNLMKESFPKNKSVIQHHRKHAEILSKTLTAFGVKNYLYTHKHGIDKDFPVRVFLVNNLR